MGYLNACCGLKFINLNDLVAVLIQDFISKLNNGLLHTDTPIFDNAANSSQVSGIQTFAIANSVANSTANSCKQHNSQKTVISANRQKALENIGKIGVKEILSAVQQCWKGD